MKLNFIYGLVPNIRLTNQNEGYIEIKTGTIWRKVVEENWDENYEKMLCQYFGFEETDGNTTTETRGLESGQQIAIGDLICYNTQSNEASCCVNLKSSTSNTSTMIPFVKCKYKHAQLLATSFPM